MAKELPYFKFEPQAWDTGNIQMCSRESKGLFIDLCSLYWSRLGEVPHALALQKLCSGNKSALQELVEHEIIGVVEGQIVIEFLDEQLSEFADTSEKRRNAANKRWKDASALQMESKSNAIKEEEIIKEENKEEKKKEKPLRAYDVPFVNGCLVAWEEWEKHRKEIKKKITPQTAKKQIQFLGGRPENEIIAIINQSITNGWTGLFEIKEHGNNFGKPKESIRRADATIQGGKAFGNF